MRKRVWIFLSALTLFGLTSCKQFFADLAADLSYWSSHASIVKAELPAEQQKDSSGAACIGSEDDKIVLLKLSNPRGFMFKMPSDSGAPDDVIVFNSAANGTGGGKPVLGTDFDLVQSAPDKLKLTYKKGFLQKNEWGAARIDADITLYNRGGRKFASGFKFNLKANTKPPKPEFKALCKTRQTGTGKNYYVICLQTADMDKTVNGELLHKDIKKLFIKGRKESSTAHNGESIIGINGSGDGFEISEEAKAYLLKKEEVEPLPSSPPVPEGKWMIYFKTGVETGGEATSYDIRLADESGLMSETVTAVTAANKVKDVTVSLVSGSCATTVNDDNNQSSPHEITCGQDGKIKLRFSTETERAVIHYDIIKLNPLSSVANSSGSSPLEKELDGGEDEGIKYSIKFYATKSGCNQSTERTLYYTVKKKSKEIKTWKALKAAIAAAQDGDTITIEGEIKATNAAGDSGEIVIDKNLTVEGKTGKATDILNADKVSFGTTPFRIFKVEAGKKLTLKKLTLKNGKNDETDTDGSPNPKGKGGAVYSEGELEIDNVIITECEAKYAGGGIYCKMAGSGNTDERKFLMENTDVTDCKVLSPGNGIGGGVNISGDQCLMNVKMTNVKIKKNKADKWGAGLYLGVSQGAKTTADSVVLEKITLEKNELTDTAYHQAAGGGGMVFSSYNNTNAITLKECTITKNTTHSNGGGIKVHEATLKLQDCTIEENEAAKGGGVYVKDGCSLTLEHVQITGNKAGRAGGAVCAKGATVTMENCNLKGNQAKENGGAVCAEKDGTTPADITIKGGTIGGEGTDGNEATNQYSFGGGIYVNDGCSLTLDHVQITGNKAGRAGGIRANRSTVKITGCTITENRAEGSHVDSGGGGVYTNGGTLDMTGCTLTGNKAENNGGGMNIENTTVTIKDCTLTGNTAENNGGGVYVNNGTFTMQGSTQIAENNDIYLTTGTKINLEGSLNPEGGIAGRITPGTYPTGSTEVQVLDGDITTGTVQNYTKFTVTPEPKGSTTQHWTIDNQGKLKKQGGGFSVTSWAELKTAVENATGHTEIEIEGEIKAGSSDDKIEISKSITIKKKDGAGNAKLTAEFTKRLFHIKSGGILTLENLTLKGVKTISENGGGIEVNGGELVLNNTDMENFKTSANGGAVYVTGKGILEMKGTSKIIKCEATGNKSGGGALYLNGQECKVTMKAGTEISGCKAITTSSTKQNKGGAVYITSGTFELKGGKINKNQSEADGGGIYMDGGTFNMTAGEINGNEALNEGSGGGIYMNGGTFNMSYGTIGGTTEEEGNKAEANYGGGVCLASSCTFNMSGGTIQSNTSEDGAGVYIMAGTFNMTGGTIGRNKEETEGKGSGIHLADNSAKLKMSGSAKVSTNDTPKNDIYLETGAKITVTGSLTGTAPIGQITPQNYAVTTQVLDGDITTGTPQNYTKFTVTPQDLGGGNKQHWKIDEHVKLKKDFAEVPFANLHNYLSTHAPDTEVNRIKVTGLTKNDLKGSNVGVGSPSPLGQVLKDNDTKKVSLILPERVEGLEDMSNCFNGCTSLIEVSGIPANVTNMGRCFKSCSNLTKVPALPLSVKNMTSCFFGCTSLTQAPNIPVSVTDMSFCFNGCTALTIGPDIPASVTNMSACFKSCSGLTQAPVLPLSVTNMTSCFFGCTSLTQAPNIPVSVTDMSFCFYGCTSLTQAPIIQAKKVKNMGSCFYGCTSLTQAPNIPVSVTDMSNCFYSCTALTIGPDIPASVKNMQKCFQNCSSMRSVKLYCDYNSYNINGSPAFNNAFSGCSALEEGGIKVPQVKLGTYKAGASTMGTTANKFSGF